MFKKLIMNCRYPEGFLGKMMLGLMNKGHGPLIKQVLDTQVINDTDIVLDIGCGGGIAINRMANKAKKVYGIDYAEAAVQKSLDRNKAYASAGKVEVKQANVAKLPFEKETFDLVTAFETIYFWPDLASNFADIFKLIKPKGQFLIAIEAYMENGEAKNFSSLWDSIGCNLYSAEELKVLLIQAGFVRVEEIKGKGVMEWLCVKAVKE